MEARGGQPTAGNGGSRKNHHDHIAGTQTNSHRCSGSIGYSKGLPRQGRAATKAGNLSAERRAIASLMNFERPPDWKPPSRRRAGGPTMFARIGIMRALNLGHVREFNPDRKDPHWGRRKLARDR